MKRQLIAWALCLLALASSSALGVQILLDGAALPVTCRVENGTTYVSLRQMVGALCDNATVTWASGQAVVTGDSLTLTARPGDLWLVCNGSYIPGSVKALNGTTLVPIRTLARALACGVEWDPATRSVLLASSGATPGGNSLEAPSNYSADDLYWLSRIISAESRGESLKGKIAVGCVVLNRVDSPDFPGTIYDVIFDSRWGGQFEPVRNGSVYDTPTEESVLAAQLCLDGARTADGALYFLAPSKAQSFWIVRNRSYVTTIGGHDFYR